MFDSIRKRQRLLLFVLLVLILPSFVFFGISGYDGMLSSDRKLAVVEGRDISPQEFDAAQRRQIEQLRQMLGEAFDASLFDTPQARTELLEGLITQKAIAHEAMSRRVLVTDDRIRQTILGIPGLKREDGSFDDARYKALLSAQNLTPAGFEAQLRKDLTMQALPDAVQSSTIVPRSVRERIVALQEERREIRELRFAAADFAAKVTPTQDQLEAYYTANGAAFETPEVAKIEYVVLRREALAAGIKLPPEDVKTYYQQNLARYATPEERRASHILIKAGADAKQKAEALLAELRADASKFESLAKARSDDPGSAAQGGDLGFFGRAMMVKPFADAVFEMKEGEIRGPVETEFGQHLILLTGIRPGAERPFEAVRAEIEQEIRAQKASSLYVEAAEAFTNMVYEQSDSLQPPAQKWGLEVFTADGVRRQPSPDAQRGTATAHPRLLAALFTDEVLRNKRNTEAVEIAPGQLAAARVLEYRPAVRRPLSEVTDAVRERVIAQEAGRLAREAGQSRLAELKGGKGGDGGFGAARTVSRASPEDLPPAAVDAVFRIPVEPLPSFGGVDLGEAGYTIVQLLKVSAPSAEDIARRDAVLAPQLERVLAQQDVTGYIDALKGRSDIVRYPDRLTGGLVRP